MIVTSANHLHWHLETIQGDRNNVGGGGAAEFF